ncbi:hypothetical protein ACFT4A_41805 [Streptomyces sp. NPDC057099]|uniref:hypothetical protein n=1 Tax=Streptomyces sp. NPDC057099 TaxID=3346019 RepID=UPI003644A4D5
MKEAGERRVADGMTVGKEAVDVMAENAAVTELLALSGRALPLLRQWMSDDPDCGVARALLTLVTSDRLDDARLKEQLVVAHRDAQAAGERQASVVYGVFLHTHRQYRLAADHLVAHFARWPADELAGLMLGAFFSSGDPAYRARGDALVERRPSWPGRTAGRGRAGSPRSGRSRAGYKRHRDWPSVRWLSTPAPVWPRTRWRTPSTSWAPAARPSTSWTGGLRPTRRRCSCGT